MTKKASTEKKTGKQPSRPKTRAQSRQHMSEVAQQKTTVQSKTSKEKPTRELLAEIGHDIGKLGSRLREKVKKLSKQ